jgi:hypothetical protein
MAGRARPSLDAPVSGKPDVLNGHRVGLSTGADEATRDDWEAALRHAVAFGVEAVELCAIRVSRFESLLSFLDARPAALQPFGYVAVHAPANEAVGRWSTLGPQLASLPRRVETIVVHPDTVDDAALPALRPLGSRLCLENMDCAKAGGRFPAELQRFFDAAPQARFCLDVAHVQTHDRSLALGHELLDAFGERLQQLHVSGIEPDGTHRETRPEDLLRYAPLTDRCRGMPFLLEGLPGKP